MNHFPVFVVSRLSRPGCYPDRAPVCIADWNENDTGYEPVEFTHKVVRDNAENCINGGKWADVEDPSPSQLGKRKTFVGGDGIADIDRWRTR